jgi:hypothetical protein
LQDKAAQTTFCWKDSTLTANVKMGSGGVGGGTKNVGWEEECREVKGQKNRGREMETEMERYTDREHILENNTISGRKAVYCFMG